MYVLKLRGSKCFILLCNDDKCVTALWQTSEQEFVTQNTLPPMQHEELTISPFQNSVPPLSIDLIRAGGICEMLIDCFSWPIKERWKTCTETNNGKFRNSRQLNETHKLDRSAASAFISDSLGTNHLAHSPLMR